jgi:hypothetical protein
MIGILPSEIDTVEEIGTLDDYPVRLARTTGGLWMGVGKNKGKEEVLASGSHPAIVRYNIKKTFPSFKASMMKSEHFKDADVIDLTKSLPQDLRDQSYSLVKLVDEGKSAFIVSKNEVELTKYEVTPSEGAFIIEPTTKKALTGAERAIASIIIQMATTEGKDVIIQR